MELELLGVEELKRLWSRVFTIPTGCKALDRLLGGGLPSSHVTLVYGERSSGKTQLCHQVVAHYLVSNPKALAVYIDVDLTFSPERLTSIAKRYGVSNSREILSRALYYRPTTFEEQDSVLGLLDEAYEDAPHGLVIVDSLSSLVRGEYGVAVVEMQRALSSHVRRLQDYAIKRNVVVVVTDNVRLAKAQEREVLLPVSSQALELSITHLRLVRGPGNLRICRVEASPILPEGEAAFLIKEEGLVDL
jgi:RecA/RadA recombinase